MDNIYWTTTGWSLANFKISKYFAISARIYHHIQRNENTQQRSKYAFCFLSLSSSIIFFCCCCWIIIVVFFIYLQLICSVVFTKSMKIQIPRLKWFVSFLFLFFLCHFVCVSVLCDFNINELRNCIRHFILNPLIFFAEISFVNFLNFRMWFFFRFNLDLKMRSESWFVKRCYISIWTVSCFQMKRKKKR